MRTSNMEREDVKEVGGRRCWGATRSSAVVIVLFLLLACAPLSPAALLSLERLQEQCAQCAREGLADLRTDSSLAAARLNIEKAELYLRQGFREPDPSVQACLTTCETALRACEEKRDVHIGSTGLVERAYVSAADDSPQPYWVWVPRDYKPAEKYPLIVMLHGYDPSITKTNPWIPSQDVFRLAEQKGFITAVPYGRRNTDFVGIGEVDVLEVVHQVQRFYTIDPDRVFLLGVSMGGYGAWVIGLHHPELFAGLGILCGRTDHYLWQNLERERVPGFKRRLIDADNPLDLAANGKELPVLSLHGELDSLVNVEQARRMVAKLKEMNAPITYRELPGQSHWIYFDLGNYQLLIDGFVKQSKKQAPQNSTAHGERHAQDRPPSAGGPFRRVYERGFLFVRGTSGGETEQRKMKDTVQRAAEEWQRFADGWPRIKDDRDVTEEDMKRFDLIAFGNSGTNQLIRQVADKLPVQFGSEWVRVGEHKFHGADLGLVFAYRNPLNPERLLAVYDGEFWGRGLPLNHKLDLLPEFMVFDSQIQADGANRYLCAGFFDAAWKLSPQLTWLREDSKP